LTPNLNIQPDIKMSLKQSFGIDSDMEVDAFSKRSEYVPEIDKNYKFDRDTTLAIISGFAFNKRVLVQGYHGTGKSTHIEQIAARLNWPCIRVNLDSHVSRIDLIGKDAIVVKDGKQITEFKEGILPWSIQNPVALVFDEYDAGRPDVMFVIQRVLEAEGNFTLLDKNKVIKQNKFFRLFATSNTVGLGDTTGLYHGTQQINQGQMDRWNIVTSLNYLSLDREMEIVLAKNKNFFYFLNKNGKKILELKSPFIQKAIHQSCLIKKKVVEADEKELGIRKILNFGHTFAHAFEATLRYSTRLNHGEAVILGVKIAAKFSLLNKILNKKEFNLINDHLNDLSLPRDINKFFSIKNLNTILSFMKKDKKNNTEKVNLVLLKKIGSPVYKLQFNDKIINLFLKKELTK